MKLEWFLWEEHFNVTEILCFLTFTYTQIYLQKQFCWQYFDFSSCETNNSSYVSCLVKCQQMWKSGCPNIWNQRGSDQTVSRCHCIETYSYHKACTVLLLPKRPQSPKSDPSTSLYTHTFVFSPRTPEITQQAPTSTNARLLTKNNAVEINAPLCE